MSKKHRKRYEVYKITRTLAYTVRSETNTYTLHTTLYKIMNYNMAFVI